MSNTTNLQLPMLEAAQAQKHVTVNETFQSLDALVHLSVLDRDLTAPPGVINDGDRYIVGPSATGAWASQDKNIAAYQDGAWAFYNPREGWHCWVADEDIALLYDGADWVTPFGEIILDADGDTSIRSSADDQIDFKLGSKDLVVFKDDAEIVTVDSQAATFAQIAIKSRVKTYYQNASGFTLSAYNDADEAYKAGAFFTQVASTHPVTEAPDGSESGVVALAAAKDGNDAASLNAARFTLDGEFDTVTFDELGQSTDLISMWFRAEDSASNITNYCSYSHFIRDATDGSETSEIQIKNLSSGSSNALNLKNGIKVGAPSGGWPGIGKLNAVDLEINGTSVCYPLEKFLDGAIDEKKWHDRMPNEKREESDDKGKVIKVDKITTEHEGLKRFKALTETLDPYDLDAWWEATAQNRHLPVLYRPDEFDEDPDELGSLSLFDLTTRLTEALEIQTVHIHKLNERVKALEGPKPVKR